MSSILRLPFVLLPTSCPAIFSFINSSLPVSLCLTEYAHFVEVMFVQAQTTSVRFQTQKFQQFDRIV